MKAYQRQPDSVIHYQERHQLLQESLLNDKILSQVSNFETKSNTKIDKIGAIPLTQETLYNINHNIIQFKKYINKN